MTLACTINDVIAAVKVNEDSIRAKPDKEMNQQLNLDGRDRTKRLKAIEKRLAEITIILAHCMRTKRSNG